MIEHIRFCYMITFSLKNGNVQQIHKGDKFIKYIHKGDKQELMRKSIELYVNLIEHCLVKKRLWDTLLFEHCTQFNHIIS